MAKTKNTHAFQNDIKHYDHIRDILRHLFMYGNLSKEELVERKLSKSISSFYDTIQRIQNYLDGQYLDTFRTEEKGTGKKFRFLYDPFKCPVNYLAETYQNCSYVLDDFIIYFFLMQLFVDPDMGSPYAHLTAAESRDGAEESLGYRQEFTVDKNFIAGLSNIYEDHQERLEALNGVPNNEDASLLVFTRNKVRPRIAELADLGILTRTGKDTYRLSDDLFAQLAGEELPAVQLMTQFFYNSSFLTVPGYYLSSTIREYDLANCCTQKKDNSDDNNFFNKQKNPVFFYRNGRLQNVINDDITWALLNAIHNTEAVRYQYRSKTGELREYTALPMKLVLDQQYGRQYFFCYDYTYKMFNVQRMSAVSKLTAVRDITPPQKFEFAEGVTADTDIHSLYQEVYAAHFEHVWNIAADNGPPSDVLIHFTFPADTYAYHLSRLKANRHHGQIRELGGGRIDFSVTVQSEQELVPWIRSYGAAASVDKVQNPALAERIKSDWERALKQYGAI